MKPNLSTEHLKDHESLNKPTYEGSVVQGLKNIMNNPYDRNLDRHIVMALPNSKATTKGTDAYKFLQRSGELSRNPESGIKVTLQQGQSFKNKLTGENETTLMLDFEYSDKINLAIVERIMLG